MQTTRYERKTSVEIEKDWSFREGTARDDRERNLREAGRFVIEERRLGNEIKVYYLPLATQAEWCFSMNLRQFLALYEGSGRVSADKYVQVNRQVRK